MLLDYFKKQYISKFILPEATAVAPCLCENRDTAFKMLPRAFFKVLIIGNLIVYMFWIVLWGVFTHVISVNRNIKLLQKKSDVEEKVFQQFPLYLFQSRLAMVIHPLIQNNFSVSSDVRNASSHELSITNIVKTLVRNCAHWKSLVSIWYNNKENWFSDTSSYEITLRQNKVSETF